MEKLLLAVGKLTILITIILTEGWINFFWVRAKEWQFKDIIILQIMNMEHQFVFNPDTHMHGTWLMVYTGKISRLEAENEWYDDSSYIHLMMKEENRFLLR